jgi:hypothetical protein
MVLLVINNALRGILLVFLWDKTSHLGQTIFLVYQQFLVLILHENRSVFDIKTYKTASMWTDANAGLISGYNFAHP